MVIVLTGAGVRKGLRKGTWPSAETVEGQLPLNTIRSVTLGARWLWLGFEYIAEE